MKSPYMLKDGTNILSVAGARLGKAAVAHELRISMNGWRAQHLIHNCAAFNSVAVEDLEAYAIDKKIRPQSFAVDSVLASIKGSIPLTISRRSDGVVGVAAKPVSPGNSVTTLQLQSLGAEVRRMFTDPSVFKLVPVPGQTYLPVLSGVWGNWEVPGRAKPVYDFVKAAGPTPSNANAFLDPVQTFKSLINRYLNVPFDQIEFAGSVQLTKTSTSVPTYAELAANVVGRKGYTVIYGPQDMAAHNGYFVIPRIPGVKAVLIGEILAQLDNRTGSYTAFTGGSGRLALPAQLITDSAICVKSATSSWNAMVNNVNSPSMKAVDDCVIVPDVAPTLGAALTPAALGIPSELHLALGSPVMTVLGDTGQWGAYSAGYDGSRIRFEGLFYALPNGFKEMEFTIGTISPVSEGAGYGSVIGVAPTKVRTKLTMSVVRAYMRSKLLDKTITAKDRLELETALTKSEQYADGALYGTVYANGWVYPSTTDISGLEIVSISKKAEQDIMNEDLGSGVTFAKAGAKFDKLRASGQRMFAAVRMVDDAVVIDDMVSSLISGRFYPLEWVVSPVFTDGAIVAWRGAYQGAGYESIVADDALALISAGSGYDASVVPKSDALSFLGVFEEDIQPMQSMYRQFIPGLRGSAYDGMYGVDKMAMAPVSFCDAAGFPILDFVEDDTRYRAALVFKGLGEDLQGMILTLFFVNQLDMA